MNIIITGASKGIGYSIAERYARESERHTFVLSSRSSDSLNAAVSKLQSAFPGHTYHSMACDVSQESQVKALAGFCSEKIGAADILINNAGFGIFKSVVTLSVDEFRSVLDTNLRGVFLVTRELLAPMREKKSGTIVTIASLAAKNGFATGAAYNAAKFAVRGLMQCLFLEVRSDNIRCVTICPGSVDTNFYDTIGHLNDTSKMLSPNEVAETVWLATHLPSSATISELDIRPTNPKG